MKLNLCIWNADAGTTVQATCCGADHGCINIGGISLAEPEGLSLIISHLLLSFDTKTLPPLTYERLDVSVAA